LRESRLAVGQLVAAAEATGVGWAIPQAPGKWSPSQIVEHIARAFDGSVAMAEGRPSAFPRIPALLHPPLRIVFRRLLKVGTFPKGRTTRGMNPAAGSATPDEARARIEAAHARYEDACRGLAVRGAPMRTPMFGAVPLGDFIRFMELHTRHHLRQLPDQPGRVRSSVVA
jgi:hypothetical protein